MASNMLVAKGTRSHKIWQEIRNPRFKTNFRLDPKRPVNARAMELLEMQKRTMRIIHLEHSHDSDTMKMKIEGADNVGQNASFIQEYRKFLWLVRAFHSKVFDNYEFETSYTFYIYKPSYRSKRLYLIFNLRSQQFLGGRYEFRLEANQLSAQNLDWAAYYTDTLDKNSRNFGSLISFINRWLGANPYAVTTIERKGDWGEIVNVGVHWSTAPREHLPAVIRGFKHDLKEAIRDTLYDKNRGSIHVPDKSLIPETSEMDSWL